MGHPFTHATVCFAVTGYCLSSGGSVFDTPEADHQMLIRKRLEK